MGYDCYTNLRRGHNCHHAAQVGKAQALRLIHYSTEHLTEVRNAAQQLPEGDVIGRGDRCDKPAGLWISVEGEDDWLEWCKGAGFGLSRLTHPTEIVLSPKARVLRVEGDVALREFHRTYKCQPWYADKMNGSTRLFDGSAIRWGDIAEEYDGVIIAPYVWSLRLDMDARWYYGWDCASGCLWNNRAVSELRPLPTVEIPVKETSS